MSDLSFLATTSLQLTFAFGCCVFDFHCELTLPPVFSYAYNKAAHLSTGTKPLCLVLSHPPPEFTFDHTARRQCMIPTSDRQEEYVQRLQIKISKAKPSLDRAQTRYKRNFDKSIWPWNTFTEAISFFFDVHDQASGKDKYLVRTSCTIMFHFLSVCCLLEYSPPPSNEGNPLSVSLLTA